MKYNPVAAAVKYFCLWTREDYLARLWKQIPSTSV